MKDIILNYVNILKFLLEKEKYSFTGSAFILVMSLF